MRQFVITPDSEFAHLCADKVYDAIERRVKFIMPVGVEMSEEDIPGPFHRHETQDGNAVYCSAVHEFDSSCRNCVSPKEWYGLYSKLYHQRRASDDHPF